MENFFYTLFKGSKKDYLQMKFPHERRLFLIFSKKSIALFFLTRYNVIVVFLDSSVGRAIGC